MFHKITWFIAGANKDVQNHQYYIKIPCPPNSRSLSVFNMIVQPVLSDKVPNRFGLNNHLSI